MNVSKTVLRIFGGICICLTLFLVSEKADAKSRNFGYLSEKKGVTITDYKGKEKNIKIPEKINGKKVVAIDSGAFRKNNKVRKITMPDTVEHIGYRAFVKCENLKSIRLSDNLTEIESGAFSDCRSLKRIVLPKKITVVPYACFRGCSSLKSINLENIEEIGDNAFSGALNLSGAFNLKEAVYVGKNAFYGCKNITGITFSEMLQVVGMNDGFEEKEFIPGQKSSNPFAYCDSLQYFNVSESNANFKSIDGVLFGKTGEWLVAFPGGKTGVYNVPEITKGIAEYAFAGAHISEAKLTDNVYALCDRAFMNSHITTMRLPKINETNNVLWGVDIFASCKELVSFSFPENAVTTGNIELADCTALKKVYLPDTLTQIKGGVFFGCTSLEKITIPKGVKRIPADCFYSCTGLKEINLDNIESIGVYAFYNCSSLKGSLKLSAGRIGYKAFGKCTQITDVEFLKPLNEVGVSNYDDEDEAWANLYTEAEHGAFYEIYDGHESSNPFAGCSMLSKITVPDGMYTKSIDGVLYTQDMKTLLAYPCALSGRFIVPYGVIEIASCAFDGSKASEIITSNSVVHIRQNAICNSDVASISVSKSVEDIEISERTYCLFDNCPNLKEIIVKQGNRRYSSDNGILFKKNTLVFYPPKKPGKTYTVPEKTDIAMYAFSNCRYLKKLIIPEGIKRCYALYFKDCHGIKVYLPKSIKDFEGYYIDDGGIKYVFGANCRRCTVYIHKNTPFEKQLKKDLKTKDIKINYY